MVMSALGRLIRGEYRPDTHSLGKGDRMPSVLATTEEAGGNATSQQRRLLKEPVHEQDGGEQPLLRAEGANPTDAPIHLEACDWLNVTACNTTGVREGVGWWW